MMFLLFQKEYLQIDLPFLADIRKIVTEGNVSTYLLRGSKDGKTFQDFKPYTHTKQVVCIFNLYAGTPNRRRFVQS